MPKGTDTFIQRIAKKAGALVLRRFGTTKARYSKTTHPISSVTAADLAADKLITSEIRKRYPTHGIISEESGRRNVHADYVWIIDPIDGTLDFMTGIPYFAILITLTYRGESILSVVYLPALKELFFAKRDGGAYFNGTRVRCPKGARWKHSRGGFPSTLLNRRLVAFFRRFANTAEGKGLGLGYFGAANEAYVALGRRDWCVSVGARVWDYAAGALFATEAGCIVTNLRGKPWKLSDRELLVSANPALHKELLKLTKNV